jgi:hypothetical protein
MSHRSVFDRLSTTPTHASSHRQQEERKIRERRQLRLDHEKLQSPRLDHGTSPTSGSSIVTSPKRTPRQMDEFFGRIYKQDTVCSLHHHNVERPHVDDNVKDDAESKEPPMTLIVQTKSSKEEIDLGRYPEVRTSIHNYWNGKLSGRGCALDILEALWKRDCALLDDKMWEVYPARVEEDRDAVGVFYGENLLLYLCTRCQGIKLTSCLLPFQWKREPRKITREATDRL